MQERLHQLIAYKTGGRQSEFAKLMNWRPQYLSKLLKGECFGLNPVLALLKSLPEVDARWLLLGEGEMLSHNGVFALRHEVAARIQSLIDYERFIPVMTAEELNAMERAVKNGLFPRFESVTMVSLEQRLNSRQNEIDARFRDAIEKSTKSCKTTTAKKS